jgi:hypothetical protein
MTSKKKDHKNMKKHLKNNPQAVTPSAAKSNPEPQPQENFRKDALSTGTLGWGFRPVGRIQYANGRPPGAPAPS